MKKVAVITGGFGGIGYEVAQRLDAMGYNIVILSRSADSARNVEKLAALTCERKLGISCDITRTADIIAAKEIIVKEFGYVDVLVNSAGTTTPIPMHKLDELTDEIFDNVVSVNLRSVFAVIRTFQPCLSENSVIVNLSSAAAQRRGGSSFAYAASKAGLDSLTRNIAVTLAPKTRVVGVAPGFVDTSFNSDANKQLAISSTPLNRVATVDDVAEVVVGAVNQKFLNGVTIVVDGGRSI